LWVIASSTATDSNHPVARLGYFQERIETAGGGAIKGHGEGSLSACPNDLFPHGQRGGEEEHTVGEGGVWVDETMKTHIDRLDCRRAPD